VGFSDLLLKIDLRNQIKNLSIIRIYRKEVKFQITKKTNIIGINKNQY